MKEIEEDERRDKDHEERTKKGYLELRKRKAVRESRRQHKQKEDDLQDQQLGLQTRMVDTIERQARELELARSILTGLSELRPLLERGHPENRPTTPRTPRKRRPTEPAGSLTPGEQRIDTRRVRPTKKELLVLGVCMLLGAVYWWLSEKESWLPTDFWAGWPTTSEEDQDDQPLEL